MSSPDPNLYALLHVGNPGDATFYLRLCADAQTVLEVGCGDGRLLEPLARQGNTVVGVEPDLGLRKLALARQRRLPPEVAARVTIVDGDMRTLALGQRFDRVIIPYCGLYCLRDDAEVRRALAALAGHLAPEGLLAFDGYAIHDPEGMEGYGDFDHLTTLRDGKTTIEVYERDDHDVPRHAVTVTYFHEISKPGTRMRTHSYSLRHHYLVCDTVPDHLEAAGLGLIARFGDFEGAAFDEDAEHQVVVAGLLSELLAAGEEGESYPGMEEEGEPLPEPAEGEEEVLAEEEPPLADPPDGLGV